MENYNYHQPVLLDSVLSFVPKNKKLTYIDLTLGRAGHSQAILARLKKGSRFLGVDKDEKALEYCKVVLKPYEKDMTLSFLHSGYSQALDKIKESGLTGADFILMDIGVSSPQFDDPSRGFSYRYDAVLDMRMDQSQKMMAKDLVNHADEKELIHIFRDLGQCPIYYPVVKKILVEREKKPIETTFELVDIIKSSLPQKELRKQGHPAKQFFLGLRYEVNGEIRELMEGLEKALDFLNSKGRLVIISFNSEEDKIVKGIFKKRSVKENGDKYHPVLDSKEPDYILLTKKPITPSEEEIAVNNRAKPSILRAIERR